MVLSQASPFRTRITTTRTRIRTSVPTYADISSANPANTAKNKD